MIWAQFAIATGIIVCAGCKLSHYGNQIANRTGLGQTFIGIILFSTITSLPELTVCITSTSVVGAPDFSEKDRTGSTNSDEADQDVDLQRSSHGVSDGSPNGGRVRDHHTDLRGP